MPEKLAILGGEPTIDGRVAPEWPQFDQAERQAVLEALESRKWNQGAKVEAFEEAFAAFQDAEYGVACTGGTVALEIACRAAGVGVGDEVITSPYTFGGTVVAILKAGATPTFADIDPDTNNIDPDEIEKAITPRTRAVMVVHFGGLACDMKRIHAIARKHNLAVLEDAAHGWGASYEDRGLGSLGLASGFSFQQSKNMTAGEGGIALTNDEGVADAMACAVNAGRSRYNKAPEHMHWGGNHRMAELGAAVLLCQLQRVEAQTDVREQNAAQLTRTLSQIEGIDPIKRLPEATRVSWHAYGARFYPEAFEGVSREAFVRAMHAEGVPVSTGYREPVYKNVALQQDWNSLPYTPFAWTGSDEAPDYKSMYLPRAEQYCKERLTLSQTLLLAEEDKMQDVCHAFQKVRDQAKALKDWEAKG